MSENSSGRGKRLKIFSRCVLAGGALLVVTQACHLKPVASNSKIKAAASSPFQRDDVGARKAFLAAYPVFMHPRCMNCHPVGDVPLQGDDSHLHAQNVKRGPDGKGLYALKCANCHQLTNLPGENMPPGGPNWHLPPPEMRMVFEGRTPAELARQLQDPKQNGGRTLNQIITHVTDDKLVMSIWSPDNPRTKPPLSHDEFARQVRLWVEKGAAIPE